MREYTLAKGLLPAHFAVKHLELRTASRNMNGHILGRGHSPAHFVVKDVDKKVNSRGMNGHIPKGGPKRMRGKKYTVAPFVRRNSMKEEH